MFRLRHTMGPIGMGSPSPLGVAGIMLPPSPQAAWLAIALQVHQCIFCLTSHPRPGGMATQLCCSRPEVAASLPLPVSPCGVGDISPGWRHGSLVKRDCCMVIKTRVRLSTSTSEACNPSSRWVDAEGLLEYVAYSLAGRAQATGSGRHSASRE